MLTVLEECTLTRWIRLPRAWVNPPHLAAGQTLSFLLNLQSHFYFWRLLDLSKRAVHQRIKLRWARMSFIMPSLNLSPVNSGYISISESESDRWQNYLTLVTVVLVVGDCLARPLEKSESKSRPLENAEVQRGARSPPWAPLCSWSLSNTGFRAWFYNIFDSPFFSLVWAHTMAPLAICFPTFHLTWDR